MVGVFLVWVFFIIYLDHAQTKTLKRNKVDWIKEKKYPLRAVTVTVVSSAVLRLLPPLTTLPGSLQGTSVLSLRIAKTLNLFFNRNQISLVSQGRQELLNTSDNYANVLCFTKGKMFSARLYAEINKEIRLQSRVNTKDLWSFPLVWNMYSF